MLTSEANGTNKKKKRRKHEAEEATTQPQIGELNPSVGSHVAKKQKEAVEPPASTPPLPDSGGPEVELRHEKPSKGTGTGNRGIDAAEKAPEEGKNQPVLPWMRLPVKIEAGQGVPLEDVRGLDERLQTALKACGFVELFPVQAAAWQVTAGGHSAAHDLCISAPTGSGKTLAYVLPVLQGLVGRCVPRLRCLVVLPTRDLAAQVFKVFADLCPILGLRVGLAAAQASVGTEAATLFPDASHNHHSVHGVSHGSNDGVVDILVATPGRLMTHLKGTPVATLNHLRYLVIDETDRLLRQSYQDWLPFVTAATADAGRDGGDFLAGGPRRRVLKIVASATLTRDPSKIERLGLHCPRYIALGATDHRYALPKSLKEFKVVCAGADKPLVTIALLHQLVHEPTLVFTASVESTRRLYVLLSAVASLKEHVLEFSSLNSGPERAAALAAFRGGAARILVASDGMTRGMDVPSVANVVNYDAPVYAKTYVHRAGRTARGGREGRVFTVLRVEEVRHFKGLLRKVDNAFVKDHALPKDHVEAARPEALHALSVLQAYLASEG